ncbi:MAG: FHA domain-containing protein [Corynebacteriales bacterium]|nr:FHA domain-containing protein [Mycobacteriales bacterium]
MQLRFSVFRPTSGGGSATSKDVLVTAPPGAPLGDLANRWGSPLFAGTQRLHSQHVLGEPPLLDGARLWVGAPEPIVNSLPPHGRQLHVIGGPATGAVHPLSEGEIIVGRLGDITIDDPDLSREHFRLLVTSEHVAVADLESTNGSYIDEEKLTSSQVLGEKSVLRAGSSSFVLVEAAHTAISLRPDGLGALGVLRPPRMKKDPKPLVITYPRAPEPPHRQRIPWLLSLAPAVVGGALFFFTGANPLFFAFMLLSPIFMLLSVVSDRVSGARQYRKAKIEHRKEQAKKQLELATALNQETQQRFAAAPSPAQVMTIVSTPTMRLWERRISDEDALCLRVGVAHMPAVLTKVDDRSAPELIRVPVTIELNRTSVIGVAGPARYSATRWWLGQLMAQHSPRELRIIVLSKHPYAWNWMRWIPHIEPLGDIAEQLAAIDRIGKNDARLLVVIEEAARLRTIPGIAELLASQTIALCMAEKPHELPEECRASITFTSSDPSALLTQDDAAPLEINADLVNPEWADSLATALVPLRDVTPGRGSSVLPGSARLLDILGEVDAQLLTELWQPGAGDMGATLGVSDDGPLSIDLAADGPHTLIAGTTGSGKSELLQSLIAALAIKNRPDELSFLLIDYKGGAAFAGCAALPHTVGMVTDLDSHLTARALHSMRAELKRREKLLADHGVPDITAYSLMRARTPELPPLARLVLVVDEFAALATELPELLTGLVDVARRARSLGIHLVLATQRPSGVISADIQANTSLRICLRVTDASESHDVIKAPDAAALAPTVPGRAVIRRGNRLIEFQVARITTSRPATNSAITVTELDSDDREADGAPGDKHPSDLAQVVALIVETTAALGIQAPPSPWLEPLPETVNIEALPKKARPNQVPYGLLDEPQAQKQSALCLSEQHVLIAGGPRSGRSTTLRAIATSLARTARDAEFIAFDCAGAGLGALRTLSQCRAFVAPLDPDHLSYVLTKLDLLIAERRGQLAQTPDAEHPLVVVLLDGWEGFAEATTEEDQLIFARILRAGITANVRVVITGGRSSLTHVLLRGITERLVLPHLDRDTYLAAGLSSSAVTSMGSQPGRAWRVEGAVMEAQLAMPSVAAQDSEPHQAPWLPLPGDIMLDDELALADGPWRFPLGVSYHDGAKPHPLVSIDLAVDGPGFLVAGPARSGRSGALAHAARWHLNRNRPVFAITARRSALTEILGITFFTPDQGIELQQSLDTSPEALLVADDAELYADSPVEAVLLGALRAKRPLMASGESSTLSTTYRGLLWELRRGRTGILLSPRRHDGDLLSAAVPAARLRTPGRGAAVIAGETLPVQLFRAQ